MPILGALAPIVGVVGGLASTASSIYGMVRGGGGGGGGGSYGYVQDPARTAAEERIATLQVELAKDQFPYMAALQEKELEIRNKQVEASNLAIVGESQGKQWLGIGAGVFLLGILFLIFKKKKLIEI